MKRLTLLAIAVIVACSFSPAQTIQATWQQPACFSTGTGPCSGGGFSSASAAGPSSIFRNVNQASHVLIYCVTGGPSALSIQLEESADGSTGWTPISQVGTATANCNILSAGGYYFAVRANLKVLTGGISTLVTSVYTASTGTVPPVLNAGQSFLSQVVTYDSILSPFTGESSAVQQVKSTAVQVLPTTGNYVLYGATVYNPNAGTVYVGFYNAPGSPPSGANVMLPVPAGQSIVLNLPVQGVSFPAGLAINCSTALASNADPASNCVITALVKAAFTSPPYNGVPN